MNDCGVVIINGRGRSNIEEKMMYTRAELDRKFQQQLSELNAARVVWGIFMLGIAISDEVMAIMFAVMVVLQFVLIRLGERALAHIEKMYKLIERKDE